jgi:hypothetical protein
MRLRVMVLMRLSMLVLMVLGLSVHACAFVTAIRLVMCQATSSVPLVVIIEASRLGAASLAAAVTMTIGYEGGRARVMKVVAVSSSKRLVLLSFLLDCLSLVTCAAGGGLGRRGGPARRRVEQEGDGQPPATAAFWCGVAPVLASRRRRRDEVVISRVRQGDEMMASRAGMRLGGATIPSRML